MALDERYIVASDLEQYFVDKDSGLPLSNGTITFYKDNARNVPKSVFQLSGAPPNYIYTSMGAQITLSINGTVQNSSGDNEIIYYYPYDDEGNLDLYFIVVKDKNGIEQFTRQAWPNIAISNDANNDNTLLQNQISNPNFTNVFINENKITTYSVNSPNETEFEFAPNWDFVIAGTGSVDVQRIPVSGNENVPSNPAYVIDIEVSLGISKCYLRQRFYKNSGLWSSNPNNPIFLSSSIVARNELGGTAGIEMFYMESTGTGPISILDVSFQSTYELLYGSSSEQIPESDNTDFGSDGYIDIYLSFVPGTHIRFSSIQVIPTASNVINVISYDTNSTNRQEALQGDYYLPRLINKNIDSFLIGWDFIVNPFQFGSSGTISDLPIYIADQTISGCGLVANVNWDRDNITKGLRFTTNADDDAFYIMQYLSGNQVKNILNTRLSVNISCFQTDLDDNVKAKIYLFRAPSTSTIPILPSSIGQIDSEGNFTLTNNGWTPINRSGLDIPEFIVPVVTDNTQINNIKNDNGFSGYKIDDVDQINDTDKFAIVVTFKYELSNTKITINSISCVPGDLPCRPSIKSLNEVLTDCQYYYEKSYDLNIPPATTTFNGCIQSAQALSFFPFGVNVTFEAHPRIINVKYKVQKRIPVNPTYFSTLGNQGNLTLVIYNGNNIIFLQNVLINSNYIAGNISISGCALFPINRSNALNTAPPGNAPFEDVESIAQIHYVADARLGII